MHLIRSVPEFSSLTSSLCLLQIPRLHSILLKLSAKPQYPAGLSGLALPAAAHLPISGPFILWTREQCSWGGSWEGTGRGDSKVHLPVRPVPGVETCLALDFSRVMETTWKGWSFPTKTSLEAILWLFRPRYSILSNRATGPGSGENILWSNHSGSSLIRETKALPYTAAAKFNYQ